MVGDVYRYTYRRIRVCLPVHLAASIETAIATAVELTADRRICSMGLLGLGPTKPTLRMVTPW